MYLQVTAANPAPVALKLEKVYEPCMLVTKKRYVGFMYESPAQTTPTWDAKASYPSRTPEKPASFRTLRTQMLDGLAMKFCGEMATLNVVGSAKAHSLCCILR